MNDIQEIGLGGALMLTLVIIKEVVVRLLPDKKKSNGNGASGDKSPDYWRLEIRGIVEKAIDERVVTVLETLDKTLVRIENAITTLIRWKGGD